MRNSMEAAERVSTVLGEAVGEQFVACNANVLAIFVGYLINLLAFIDTVAGALPLPASVVELRGLVERVLRESVIAMSELDREHNRRN